MGGTNPALCPSIGKNKGYQGKFPLIFYEDYIILLSAPTFRNDIQFCHHFSLHLTCLLNQAAQFPSRLMYWKQEEEEHSVRRC